VCLRILSIFSLHIKHSKLDLSKSVGLKMRICNFSMSKSKNYNVLYHNDIIWLKLKFVTYGFVQLDFHLTNIMEDYKSLFGNNTSTSRVFNVA
jgi:hypothetical protein